MTTMINIKRILSLLLLACVFMPLSQCTRNPSIFNNIQTTQTTVYYAYSNMQSDPGEAVISILSFVWPVLLLLLCLLYTQLNYKILYKLIELALCCWTAFVLFLAILFNTPLYGSIFAAFATSFYFLITIGEFFLIVRLQTQKPATLASS